MRNQLKLSPKTKTTVSVKNSLLYTSVGFGIFILVFTGAFFYLNMGNSENVVADVPISTVDAVNSGTWNTASIWSDGLPGDGDTIKIPQNITVTIDQDVNLNNVTIIVYGNILFTKAKLRLNAMSDIILYEGSTIAAEGAEGHNHIFIGTNQYKTTALNSLETPVYLDKDSGQSGSPIPAEKQPPTLLPIVLDYFTAQTTASNSILVEWGTVSEKENDFFTLEHSTDGKTFEIVTTVEGAGNSNQKLQYSFEDHKSSVGMNYYRLKQTDYNGDFEYFKIVGVNNSIGSTTASKTAESFKISQAYPNPFKGEINLNFEAEVNSDVEVLIQNARGEIVHKEIVPVNIGENNYQFSKADLLPPGVYYINLWNNGKKYKPQRMIKI